MRVRGIQAPGEAAEITLDPNLSARPGADGIARLLTIEDWRMARGLVGGGGWHAASLNLHGRNGGYVATISLHANELRLLARHAERLARFIDAREKGEAGPCLCSAWSHNLEPCPNDAALDYSMCRACWSPETGQATLDMDHGGTRG